VWRESRNFERNITDHLRPHEEVVARLEAGEWEWIPP
jgi:hypothetical protein